MEDFFSNLVSLYWWISVVIVGILINLASAYLKSKLDHRLSKTSIWWRSRSERQKAERQKKIEDLRNKPHEQILWAHDSLRNHVIGLYYLMVSILTFVFVMVLIILHRLETFNPSGKSWLNIVMMFILMAIGSFTAFMAYRYDRSAREDAWILRQAIASETAKDEA